MRTVPGDRHILEHRLAQLQTARTLVDPRKTKAQYDDPGYVHWKQMCEQVTEEWRECLAYQERDSEAGRLQRLTDFATAH